MARNVPIEFTPEQREHLTKLREAANRRSIDPSISWFPDRSLEWWTGAVETLDHLLDPANGVLPIDEEEL